MHKEIGYILLPLVFVMLSLTHETAAQKTHPNGFNKFYFENGKMSSEGNLKNGKPEGYWKNYYSSGSLKSEGNRKNHMLDGNWKFYSEEGLLIEEIEYAEDKRNGVTKTYSKEGFLIESTTYINDVKNGVVFTYYTNGAIHSETPFVNGKEEGKAYTLNPQGEIVAIRMFKNGILVKQENINQLDKEGKKEGLWKEFRDDRTIKNEGQYRNGERDGYWKEYSTKGELVEITKYEEGGLVKDAEELSNLDVRELYYSKEEAEGRLKFRGTYREGNKHGTHLWFAKDGEIDSAKIYRNDMLVAEGDMERGGLKQGFWTEYYYPGGEVKAKGKYTGGYRTNGWVYYYPNKSIDEEGNYDSKGRPDGEWKWYYESGQLKREESFRNGQEHGWMIEYNDSGDVILKGEYIDGKQEGEWIYEIGDHKEIGNYEYGAKMGVWKHTYLTTNKLKFEGEYFDDLPQNKHTWYFESGQKMLEGKYVSGVKEGEWRRYNDDGTILISIEYKSGIEDKVDGVKMKEVDKSE